MVPSSLPQSASRAKRRHHGENEIKLLPNAIRFLSFIFLPNSLFVRSLLALGHLFQTFQGFYPLALVATVWRTLRVWIHPGVLLVFNTYATADDGSPADRPGIFSRVRTSIVDDQSTLAWADKGEWETSEAENPQALREGDWFRLGFEPMFVDFTRSGTWYVLLSFVEVRMVFIHIKLVTHVGSGLASGRGTTAHQPQSGICTAIPTKCPGCEALESMSVKRFNNHRACAWHGTITKCPTEMMLVILSWAVLFVAMSADSNVKGKHKFDVLSGHVRSPRPMTV